MTRAALPISTLRRMGFTARKSFKVMPDVRMTVSKSGPSTSVGTKDYRVTKTASGRVTRTASLAGTGISHAKTVSTSSRGAGRRPAAPPPTASPTPARVLPKLGKLAPKWERETLHGPGRHKPGDLQAIAQSSPDAALPAAFFDGARLPGRGLPAGIARLRPHPSSASSAQLCTRRISRTSLG